MPFPSSGPELRSSLGASSRLLLIFISVFHFSFAFYKGLPPSHRLASSHLGRCRVLYSIHQALSRTQPDLSFLPHSRILQGGPTLLPRTFRTQHRRNFRP